jgi:GntR family transcriptional regulator
MVTKLIKAPVYQQLNEVLRELLRTGEFKTGERFLTERQIAERFEVSRATANKALSNLVSERILEFRKGLGTFVQPRVLDADLGLLVSFTARAAAKGQNPSTQVLSFKRIPAHQIPEAIALQLGVSGEDGLIELERLRLAEGVPVIFEHRIVVARHCPNLDAAAAAGSLYTLWTKSYGLSIAGAEQSIRSLAASNDAAARLRIKKGAPCLSVTAVGFLEGDHPLWWETTIYRGDAYEFHNRLGSRGAANASALELA